MIYTPLTKKAITLAYQAHLGQVDKGGSPYILHPFYLATQMTDEITCCVALLHDVVEDTAITFAALKEQGFPKEVVKALRLLTHHKQEPYEDYIQKIAGNPIAKKVKLADLHHNSILTRLEKVDEKALAQKEKYKKAIEYLETYGK